MEEKQDYRKTFIQANIFFTLNSYELKLHKSVKRHLITCNYRPNNIYYYALHLYYVSLLDFAIVKLSERKACFLHIRIGSKKSKVNNTIISYIAWCNEYNMPIRESVDKKVINRAKKNCP